jgi:hypothetical protein
VSDRIEKLRDAIETMHECKAEHVGSQLVIEFFRGKMAWDGMVEVFALVNHPKAKRAYAWSYPDGSDTRFVTVLEIPPVENAETAVRAAIASGQQK